MADPKCPDCKTTGIGKIVSVPSTEVHNDEESSWYEVVHCAECGHVYGVFAKYVCDMYSKPLPLPAEFLNSFK